MSRKTDYGKKVGIAKIIIDLLCHNALRGYVFYFERKVKQIKKFKNSKIEGFKRSPGPKLKLIGGNTKCF